MSYQFLSRMAENMPRLPQIALVLPICLVLVGCATRTSYMGIGFAQSRPETQLQSLARRAQAGDKQAQLALGYRFEAGFGVPLDIKRARKLYRLAALTTGGTIYVYVPPATRGGKGTTVPVNTGPRNEGLSEARERLRALDAVSPVTALRRRLEYLVRCIRTAYGCDTFTSIKLFRSARPAISDDDARQRLTEKIIDRGRRLTIHSIVRRANDRYDADISFTGAQSGACNPVKDETRRDLLCPADPSSGTMREIWRITVRNDDSLDIAIDATEHVTMNRQRRN